jgi:hypothetical protein
MAKFEQPEQTIDLDRYMASHQIRKPTAPASATFEVTIESPPPSDPMTRLEDLKKATTELHHWLNERGAPAAVGSMTVQEASREGQFEARLREHARFNARLDDVVERMQSRRRKGIL